MGHHLWFPGSYGPHRRVLSISTLLDLYLQPLPSSFSFSPSSLVPSRAADLD